MFKDLNEAIDITRKLELSKHEYADRLEAIALGDFANGVRESAENFGQIAEWLCQLAEMKDILRGSKSEIDRMKSEAGAIVIQRKINKTYEILKRYTEEE